MIRYNKPSFYKNMISNILSHFVNGSVHSTQISRAYDIPRTQTHEFFQPGPLRVNNLALPFRRPTSPRAALVRRRGGGICSTRDFAFTNGRAKRAGVRGNGIRFLRAAPRTRECSAWPAGRVTRWARSPGAVWGFKCICLLWRALCISCSSKLVRVFFSSFFFV